MSDIKINGNVIWGCLRREFASPACFLFNYVHVKGLYFDEYLKEIRSLFSVVKVRKPEASRDRSREVYIVASGYKF